MNRLIFMQMGDVGTKVGGGERRVSLEYLGHWYMGLCSL